MKNKNSIQEIEAYLAEQKNESLNILWKQLCKEYYRIEDYRLYTDLLVTKFNQAIKA